MKPVPLQRVGDYVVKMYELNSEVCSSMLSRCSFGRVGFDDEHDGPTVLPVNSLYSDGAVMFRTDAGSPLDRIADGQLVAFEADHIDPIAESGWSVLVRGTLAHVTDQARISPLAETAIHPWAPGPRDRWIEIRPERITGRIIQRQRLASEEERAPYMPPD